MPEELFKSLMIGPTVEYHGDFPLLLARSRQSTLSPLKSFRAKERIIINDRLRLVLIGAAGVYLLVEDLDGPQGECG